MIKVLEIMERLNNVLIKACVWFATLLAIAITGIVFSGVIWRYVLNNPLGWAEEIPKYCMVWMTYVGAPVVLKYGSHVSLDTFPNAMPPRLKNLVWSILHLICLCCLAVFIYYGWGAALNARSQVIIVVGGMSMFWVFLAIPAGSCLFLFSILIEMLKHCFLAIFPNCNVKVAIRDRNN